MYETIRYEVVDPVATITLNRPDRLSHHGRDAERTSGGSGCR